MFGLVITSCHNQHRLPIFLEAITIWWREINGSIEPSWLRSLHHAVLMPH